MLNVALAALAFALVSAWGLYYRGEANTAKAENAAVVQQRNLALSQAQASEAELTAQRQRAAQTDALLVERDNRLRALNQAHRAIKGEYENLRAKVSEVDSACLVRVLPDAYLERLRDKPADVHKDGKGSNP